MTAVFQCAGWPSQGCRGAASSPPCHAAQFIWDLVPCPQTLAHGITKAGVQTEMFDLLSVDPQVGRCWAGGCRAGLVVAHMCQCQAGMETYAGDCNDSPAGPTPGLLH